MSKECINFLGHSVYATCMHKSVYILRKNWVFFVILRKITDVVHGISKFVVGKHWPREKTILIRISVRNSNSVSFEIATDRITLG